MTKSVKKHEFLFPFARLSTRQESGAYDSIPFQPSDAFGDEEAPALASPTSWDREAVALMAMAACPEIPAQLRAVEENTVPSWLWRHQSRNERRAAEGDLRDMFDRIVGSAAARAWKLGLFTSEKHARSFYDETRYALMQRQIAIAPEIVAPWGLGWAYGIHDVPAVDTKAEAAPAVTLTNAAIDGLIGKAADAPGLWQKLFAAKTGEVSTVSLRLGDIATEWYSAAPNPARAAIDVMALRHNDGSLNIDALRQATRLLVVLLDLQECSDVTIGMANLAPLLLALGLGYDSDAARAMAASIAALVTAEAYAASAEMAALRGAGAAFEKDRDAVMRSLRNHRRAVYGDANDYEKLSVLPAPLALKNCPDLALVAEAQRCWDEALERARSFGLRATQVTDMTPSPALAMLMGSASQGLEPMQRLTHLQYDAADTYRTLLHPVVGEALARLSYPRNIVNAVAQHIRGARSLQKTPAINHGSLRARGLSDAAIEKIEAYLPFVTSIRLAATPWIVGVEFCHSHLKIAADALEAPRFDLLQHLGFDDADIAAADLACYGHGTARNAKILHLRHRPLFAVGMEISVAARLRMAAAVQSFVSGDTGLVARLPVGQSVQHGGEIALAAWKSGLKSLTVIFDPAIAAKPAVKTGSRRITAAGQSHAKAPAALNRQSRDSNGKSGTA